MPDATWFGPVTLTREEARTQFLAANSPLDAARGAIELCKSGDFSERASLVRFVHECQDDVEKIDAQVALLTVADDDLLARPETLSYVLQSSFEVMFHFAASGIDMLARSAVPALLEFLDEVGDIHEFHEHAFSSLDRLLNFQGSGITEEDSSVEDIAVYASKVLAQLDTPYVLSGEPFKPEGIANFMVSTARRAAQTGRNYTNYGSSTSLSVWSGLRCPTFPPGPITASDVETLDRYVARLGQLAWQPGIKYFYGHPVDGGGPSLGVA